MNVRPAYLSLNNDSFIFLVSISKHHNLTMMSCSSVVSKSVKDKSIDGQVKRSDEEGMPHGQYWLLSA